MSDDDGDNSGPANGQPTGVPQHDASGELTAELAPDHVVAYLGNSRIWSFRPDQVVAERYRIIRTIAQGGMGEVYEAEDLELGGRVALKTIRAEAAAQETLLGRFRREIQIARRVTHPNVCRLFDVSHHTIEIVGSSQLTNRIMCVSMEFLDGETLSQKLARDGAMSPGEALPIVRQMAGGLAAAHAAGVIHRDFKSGNVMLVKSHGSDGGDGKLRAVITDFGLARHDVPGECDASLTDSGVVVGTPAYMAPEQFEGKEASSASDIYSFGVVLYEMVTGRKPFDGATPISQAIQRLKAPPSSPAKFCEGLDPVWETTILRCLESDPAARFASPIDVVAALEGQAVAPGRGRRRNKTMRRHRIERAVAAVTIVALSGAAGFALYRLSTGSTPLVTSSTAEATPVIEVRPGAAVIGFKDLSGKPESRWLSTAFAEMIRTELAAGEKLRLISGEDTARVRHELDLQGSDSYSKETLASIRESLGADYVVAGSYVALGTGASSRLRLDVRVQNARTGETISAISESGTEADLLAMVASAGTRLRGVFGQGTLDTARAAGLAASRPQNPEVMRIYAEGISLLRDFDALGAKERLEKAVTIEPGFALAHAALAEAWSTLGYDARAVEEAQKAFDLSKSLGREESLAIEGRLREMQKSWKKAAEVYAVLHRFAPDELDYGIRLAQTRAAASDQAGAKEALRDLRALAKPVSDDPRVDLAAAKVAQFRGDMLSVARLAQTAIDKGTGRNAPLLVASAKMLLGWAQRLEGRFSASIETLQSARSTYAAFGDHGGAAVAEIQIGSAHFYMGDVVAAAAHVEPARATCVRIGWNSCEAAALNSLSGIAWADGRYGDAEKAMREALAVARKAADKPVELNVRCNLVTLEAFMGRSELAWTDARALLDDLEDGTSVFLVPVAQLSAGIASLQLGRIDEGRALLTSSATKSRSSGNSRFEADALMKLAIVRFFDGDLGKAASDLERTIELRRRIGERGSQADAESRLAAVRLAQKRPTDAEALIEGARRVLAEQHVLYDWVYATCVAAELRLAGGRAPEALALMEEIRAQAPRIEKPTLRIRVSVSEARVLAALGRTDEAVTLLSSAIREADRIDLPLEALGATVTLGELQSANPSTKKRAESTIERARARARALGLASFNYSADQLLAGSAP